MLRPYGRALFFPLVGSLSIAAVFALGYAVANHRGGNAPRNAVVNTVALTGTSVAPRARARLKVSQAQGGNWPLTLRVVDMPKLPPHTYYEVDLVHHGEPWESCGTFRIASAFHAVKLTLNAPRWPRRGDSWIVTRQLHGREGGVAVLRSARLRTSSLAG